MGRGRSRRHLVRHDLVAALDGDEVTAPQPWPAGRLCPATSNLPTRMMAASWRTLCAAMQRREAVGVRSGGQGQEDFMAISAARFPCATCAGRMLPPGLELITKEEASEMAKTTNGNCTNCGRKGVLSILHGGKVCNTCRYLLAAANNNVPALAGAVRTVGKTEEMIKALIPDEGGKLAVEVTSDRLREISGIVGYQGGKLDELVEAVRSRVERLCVSCEAEDVLADIREVVGYSPEQGDKGGADAVRAFVARAGGGQDRADIPTSTGPL